MAWHNTRKRLSIAGAEFQHSTNALDAVTRRRFALLGLFVPKPATFDLAAMAVPMGMYNNFADSLLMGEVFAMHFALSPDEVAVSLALLCKVALCARYWQAGRMMFW